MPTPLTFHIEHRDETTHARVGTVTTPHGSFDTPAFMPVGTQGTVKGLLPGGVAETGAQIILGNTYHLMLRPGSELIAQMGGLHEWMRWPHPILTDSGGFQVFSLADTGQIHDDGVTFRSHLDGAKIDLTPERSMRVQNELGADIIMAFDDCPPARGQSDHQKKWRAAQQKSGGSGQWPVASGENRQEGQGDDSETLSDAEYVQRVKTANERTVRWLERCVAAHGRPDDQALFGIVQGGTDPQQRAWSAERVTQIDLPGYAIGGVAVGEGTAEIHAVVEQTAPLLPVDKPRYLMGVGYERDLVAAVRSGVDMFDCVLPTRNARNANAFTPTGQVRLKNARFADDPEPIVPGCDCAACGGGFSRSYLRHLFQAGEMLGPILVSLHNLRHLQRLMLDIREAIRHNAWSALYRSWPVARTDFDR